MESSAIGARSDRSDAFRSHRTGSPIVAHPIEKRIRLPGLDTEAQDAGHNSTVLGAFGSS
jgi:hypothetical protein